MVLVNRWAGTGKLGIHDGWHWDQFAQAAAHAFLHLVLQGFEFFYAHSRNQFFWEASVGPGV